MLCERGHGEAHHKIALRKPLWPRFVRCSPQLHGQRSLAWQNTSETRILRGHFKKRKFTDAKTRLTVSNSATQQSEGKKPCAL